MDMNALKDFFLKAGAIPANRLSNLTKPTAQSAQLNDAVLPKSGLQ